MLCLRDLERRGAFLVSSNKCTILGEGGGSPKEVSGCDREDMNGIIMPGFRTNGEERR